MGELLAKLIVGGIILNGLRQAAEHATLIGVCAVAGGVLFASFGLALRRT